MDITETMIESGAEALWCQCRSDEYNEVFGDNAKKITWETESELAKELARDMSRACLTAALAVK